MYQVPAKPHYLGSFNYRASVIGIAAVLLLFSVISSKIAAHYGYGPAFGQPTFQIGLLRVYHPFAWVVWVFKFGYDKALYQYGAAAVAGMLVVIALVGVANANRHKHLADNSEALHGSARLATHEDVARSGLLGAKDGVYVGGYMDCGRLHYLKDNSPGHVLAFAPTRSGKGVSLVIPTLLAWKHSVVAYDIKGELWNLTAGYRASTGQTCLKFSPTEEQSSRFNPLAEVRIHTPREVSDSQILSQMLVIPNLQSVDPAEKYFQEAAQSLVTGMILHALYAEEIKGRVACITDVAMLFHETGLSFEDQLSKLLVFEHDPSGKYGWIDGAGNPTKTHPVVAHSVQQVLNKKTNDLSGVESTAVTAFRLFEDPLLQQATASSDFRIADLVCHERPVSLYIVIPPSDTVRLRPVVQMLLTVLANRLTETLEGSTAPLERKHRLLFMVDEFPSMRRMEIFASAMSYMAGYGIKAYLIAQDVEQLIEAYGDHQSIVSNCAIACAFPPNNQPTAKLLSDMCGERTVEVASPTYSGGRAGPMLPNTSVSLSHVGRPLLAPQEVRGLRAVQRDALGDKIVAPGEMLIFATGHPPILGTQMLYFLDPIFLQRAAIKPPVAMLSIGLDGTVTEQRPLPKRERKLSPSAPGPAPETESEVPNEPEGDIDPFFWRR